MIVFVNTNGLLSETGIEVDVDWLPGHINPATGQPQGFIQPKLTGAAVILDPNTENERQEWQGHTDPDGHTIWVDATPQSEIDKKALDEAKQKAYARINYGYTKSMADVQNGYTSIEREGWEEQSKWAKSHQAGQTPNELTILAAGKGVPADTVAASILSKDTTYWEIYAQETGKISKLRDDIEAAYLAGDKGAIDLIDW